MWIKIEFTKKFISQLQDSSYPSISQTMTIICFKCKTECNMTSHDKNNFCCRCRDTTITQIMYIDGVGAVDVEKYYLTTPKSMYYCSGCRDPTLPPNSVIYEAVIPYISAILRLKSGILTPSANHTKNNQYKHKTNATAKCNCCGGRKKFIEQFIKTVVSDHVVRDNIGITICDRCRMGNAHLIFESDVNAICDAIRNLNNGCLRVLIGK